MTSMKVLSTFGRCIREGDTILYIRNPKSSWSVVEANVKVGIIENIIKNKNNSSYIKNRVARVAYVCNPGNYGTFYKIEDDNSYLFVKLSKPDEWVLYNNPSIIYEGLEYKCLMNKFLSLGGARP